MMADFIETMRKRGVRRFFAGMWHRGFSVALSGGGDARENPVIRVILL